MSLSRKVAITSEIEIDLAKLPEKYLGIKLVRGRVIRNVVSDVEDNIPEKLSKYKRRLISFTSRAKLIKFVI